MHRAAIILFFIFAADYACGAVTLLNEPLCASTFPQLAPQNREFAGLQVVAETPRMYLGHERGREDRIYAYDKTTGQYLGRVGAFGLTFWPAHEVLPSLDPQRVSVMGIDFSQAGGEGRGTEAYYAYLRYLFEKRGQLAVTAAVDERNFPSRALHEKLGFREVRKDKRAVGYVLTKEDFDAARAKFGDEALQAFLPTGAFAKKLVPVKIKVNRTPRATFDVCYGAREDLRWQLDSLPGVKRSFFHYEATPDAPPESRAAVLVLEFMETALAKSDGRRVDALLADLDRVQREGLGEGAVKSRARNLLAPLLREIRKSLVVEDETVMEPPK